MFEWLFSVFLGCFIGGLVLTVLLLVTTGASLSHGGPDHDVGSHDVGSHDVGSHDVGSHDVSSHDATGQDHDAGSHDHDAGSHDHGTHVHEILGSGGAAIEASTESNAIMASDKGQNAPLMLMISGYLLFSGMIGILFFSLNEISIFLLLAAALIPPFLLNKLLQKGWRRVTRSETYVIPAEVPLIGMKVRVQIKVDIEGGTVRIEIPNSPIGAQHVPVLPLYPEKVFEEGAEIYIVDIERREDGKEFYLVDDDRSEIRKSHDVNI